jgi:UDP-3-O-[3-hydroxymyristoyl] N-acetylglucosamine deacetylase
VNDAGVHVSTIEHLMAALAGTGVTNALVEIDGPEVPILDGSSALWAKAILRAGLRGLDAPQEAIEVLRPVEVRDGAAVARLEPYEGFAMTFAIDFPDEAIGQQSRELDLAGRSFLQELCDSRTFCRAATSRRCGPGPGAGGTPLNAVVVDGERVMTPGGWRHVDEAVRHKMLDAVGDLSTAGLPILAATRESGQAMPDQPPAACAVRRCRRLAARHLRRRGARAAARNGGPRRRSCRPSGGRLTLHPWPICQTLRAVARGLGRKGFLPLGTPC